MTTNTLRLLERCYKMIAGFQGDGARGLQDDLEAAIAAERSKEQAKPQPQAQAQEPDLVQIASDIMGACMNGYLEDKWEDVADCLVKNDFDGLAKLVMPQQEPVAHLYFDKSAGLSGALKVCETQPPEGGSFPVYTSPQPLKPLSDDVLAFLMGEGELEGISFGEKHPTRLGVFWWRSFIRERAIEAKLGVGK